MSLDEQIRKRRKKLERRSLEEKREAERKAKLAAKEARKYAEEYILNYFATETSDSLPTEGNGIDAMYLAGEFNISLPRELIEHCLEESLNIDAVARDYEMLEERPSKLIAFESWVLKEKHSYTHLRIISKAQGLLGNYKEAEVWRQRAERRQRSV